MLSSKLRKIILASVFSALICVFTAYILHIPMGNGYIHLGDSFIYLAASILPAPYAAACAAIGGALSDTLTGYHIYILPTLIIKPLNALCFSNKGSKILNKRNLLGAVLSGIITIVGYYIVEVILYGNWIAQLATIPAGLIQAIGSLIVYYIMALALDKRTILLDKKN